MTANEDVASQMQQAVSRNAELLRGLSDTDYGPPALQEQNRFITELQSLLRDSDNKIRKLDSKRQAELKDHEKYRDSHVRRFMYKASGKADKFTERAEKEEREYFEVLQQEHLEKQTNANMRQQLDAAQQEQRKLEGVAQQHNDMQRQLDDLYHSIFGGPTPQFPDEDVKERASEEKLSAYHETRTKVEAEDMVVALLSRSVNRLTMGAQFMGEARRHSRRDMFGGGTITDMMERNALAKAGSEISEGEKLVLQAQRVSPFVRNLPAVSINYGNIMSDVFFDNIFTDMAFHDEIKRAESETLRSLSVAQGMLQEARQRYAAESTELKGREAELEEARKDLQRARERAFEQVTQQQASGESSHPVPKTQAPEEQVPEYTEKP